MLNFILNMLQCSESVLEQALSLLPFVSSSARHMEANRLEHLRAKAAKQKKYSPASWFSVIFSYRGRAAHHIRHPLAWVLVVSVVAAVVSTSRGPRKWTAWLKRVEAAEALLRMALSFLLVFRLGRSATRYWEARQKAGAMIEVCRTLASTALAHMVVGGDLDRVEHRLRWPASPRAARDEAKDEPWMSTSCSPASAVCRWVVVFPVAAKNYLRADPGDAADLEGLLSGPEVAALFAAPCQPIFVLDTMRCLVVAWAADAVAAGGRPELVAMSLQALNSNIDRLGGTFGGMERINNTPLPFVYVAHLRTFLLIYLTLVPVVFSPVWLWATPLMSFLVAYALLGIEAASVECERPVRECANHMPLDAFAAVIADNVGQTVRHSATTARRLRARDAAA